MNPTGPWRLTDLENIPKNGLKVFSCFHGGGGSTMGYKLAGYDVLGGVEIDPRMMKVYRANHNPEHSYLMGVKEFCKTPDKDLPRELFNLDILDGSPPCSSFSSAGPREKKWGLKHKFREGQADQVLDDLFFDFIAVADKLRPKLVIAENVKGLIQGNARGYVKQIYHGFIEAGYDCQLFLLDAAFMGVPQMRKRTFFIARRRDLELPKVNLEFNEKPINCRDAADYVAAVDSVLSEDTLDLWHKTIPGKSFKDVHPRGSRFNDIKVSGSRPCFTIRSSGALYHWDQPRTLNKHELLRFQTFPEDYNFCRQSPLYICGMSVPPYMTQRIASHLKSLFLSA